MASFRQRRAVCAALASLDATVIHPRGDGRAPGPRQPARLLVVSGPRAGVVVALGSGDLAVGRGWDNDVVLPDISVSRRHALLRRDGAEYVLLDQGSGNGTSVNGRAVDETRLRDGDEISLGDSVVQFVAAGATAVRSNAAAVRERRPAGVPGVSRAAACAGLAALLLGATVVGLRRGQADPGGALDHPVPTQLIDGASPSVGDRQPAPAGESNPASGARLPEAEPQTLAPAGAPNTVAGGSRSEAHAARRRAKGKRPAAVGTHAALESFDSARRGELARRDEGRPAEAIAALEQAAIGLAMAVGQGSDDLAARAGEAYRSGYVAKDIDPDVARRAFRLVVALLPPGDETAVKAQRWLDRLEGRTLAEKEASP